VSQSIATRSPIHRTFQNFKPIIQAFDWPITHEPIDRDQVDQPSGKPGIGDIREPNLIRGKGWRNSPIDRESP
jgi:hypothetical protein